MSGPHIFTIYSLQKNQFGRSRRLLALDDTTRSVLLLSSLGSSSSRVAQYSFDVSAYELIAELLERFPYYLPDDAALSAVTLQPRKQCEDAVQLAMTRGRLYWLMRRVAWTMHPHREQLHALGIEIWRLVDTGYLLAPYPLAG